MKLFCTNIVDEWLELHILEVPGPKLGPETYSDRSVWFSSVTLNIC